MTTLYETPCRDCVFAVYQGKTQTGCRFGRTEKFPDKGVELVEAQDGDREFYVVQGACRLHRHAKSPWAMKHPGRERMAVARKELQLKVDAVVALDGELTAEQARVTAESLQKQTLPPRRVVVAVNREGVRPEEVRCFLPEDWAVQFLMERQQGGGFLPRGRSIDHAVLGSPCDFYAVVSAGQVMPPGFIADLDRAVNDELERFHLLQGEVVVVSMAAHKYFKGNAPAVIVGDGEEGKRADSIEEKILHRAKAEGREWMVRNVTEVCRC